ncbi:hypothetical protein QE152_g35764 [Popillia japonica]|uniref:Uncharacterized protein n=1 Tax=Popillia japonica TaxID=7064 RepID=A0AAW1IEF0_POPJA
MSSSDSENELSNTPPNIIRLAANTTKNLLPEKSRERYEKCCEKIWKRRGKQYSQCCISERSSFGDGGAMVWVGVCMNARTELVLIDGNLTADRYINECLACLANYAMPFGPYIGNNFLLQQGVLTLNQLTRGHAWDMLRRQRPSESLQKLSNQYYADI